MDTPLMNSTHRWYRSENFLPGRGSVNSEQKDNIHRVLPVEKEKKKILYRFSRHIVPIVSNWKLSYPLSSTFRINPSMIFVIFLNIIFCLLLNLMIEFNYGNAIYIYRKKKFYFIFLLSWKRGKENNRKIVENILRNYLEIIYIKWKNSTY